MPAWLTNLLISVGSILLTLTTTLIFNRLVGVPKELKKQKETAKQKEEQMKQENNIRDQKLAALEAAVASLPGYRAQSLQIQQQLQNADTTILATCQQIQASVIDNQNILNNRMAELSATLSTRLDRLEKRERNKLRDKILEEYRLFTDLAKNPQQAWSEMEQHAFFELVKDYESLGGNDYVHSTVIPAMNELNVVLMSDKITLTELMHSRKM